MDMMYKINPTLKKKRLIYLSACAALRWESFKEFLPKYCEGEWKERRIYELMMNRFVNTDRPITDNATQLDDQNTNLLERALFAWGCLEEP